MRICLLNQPFHPDVAATAQMAKDLADHLTARGHEVHAIASRSIYGKSGAALPKREIIDGIHVHRVGVSLFGKKSILARAADFALFYVLASFKAMTIAKPDVIVSFTTPPFIGLVGLAVRRLRGARAVCWLMDLYPDVPVECGVFKRNGLLTRLLERVSRFILRRSDAVVVLGRCMEQIALDKGAPRDRVRFIPVWALDAGIEPIDPADNELRAAWGVRADEFVVMYSGNFGIAHDATTIMGAMEILRDDPRIRFEFVGGGARRAEVEAFIESNELARATYRDYVPIEQLNQSLAAADAHLVSIRTGLEGLVVPSKLFGCLAAGRPAIYIGDRSSEIARIIDEHECGALVEEGDARALAEAIRGMAGDPERRAKMGKNALGALGGRYSRRSACEDWADLLERVASRRPIIETPDASAAPAP